MSFSTSTRARSASESGTIIDRVGQIANPPSNTDHVGQIANLPRPALSFTAKTRACAKTCLWPPAGRNATIQGYGGLARERVLRMVDENANDPAAIIARQIKAHAAADEAELAKLRSLTMRQRAALFKSACEAAMAIERSRRAAGLPPTEPAPWPASTWEFLRKHATGGQS